MNYTIGYKIKKIREIKNISQDYVAKHLGITQTAYSNIENGKTKVDDIKLKKIASALNVDSSIIEGFNEQIIFNSCSQSGLNNTYNSFDAETIKNLYEKLLEEKNMRIQQLEYIISTKK
jgi:transcriptional regulator with XRE-family HTH domain